MCAPPPAAQRWKHAQPQQRATHVRSHGVRSLFLMAKLLSRLGSAVRHPTRARKGVRVPLPVTKPWVAHINPLQYLLAACRAALLCPRDAGRPNRGA